MDLLRTIRQGEKKKKIMVNWRYVDFSLKKKKNKTPNDPNREKIQNPDTVHQALHDPVKTTFFFPTSCLTTHPIPELS